MFFFFFFSSRRRHTRYIGDWSSDVCSSDLRRIVSELEKRCRSLSRYPKRGAPVISRRGVPLRRLVVGQYLIFYEVTDEKVFINAVVHGARDYEPLVELRTSAAKDD